MSPSPNSFDPEALLAHAGWVRGLARSLAPADVHLADDVAQDAYLAALEKTPRTDRPLGAWFATVMNNLVRQRRRGETHRRAREEKAAVAERLPSTLDHVETLSVHRALVEAVMELDEPYRETIVLRFFEELSPSAIARRQSVPVATVKTRLARGLDKLRARLDRDHGGDGRAWIMALIPVFKPSGGLTTATLGALLVQTNIKFAIGAVLILGGLFAVWNSRRDSAASSTSAQTIAESNSQPKAATQRGEAALSLGDPSTERTTALPPASTVAPATAPAVPARSLRGRVLDATQRAQAGLRVRFSAGAREVSAREFNVPVPKVAADAPAMITDASGAFELPMPMREGELVVEDAHWTTVLSSLCGPGSSESEHVIIVAPHLEHAGYVLDDAGQALAKVRIEIHLPRDFRSAFSRVLDHSAERGWVVESDERGRFEFSDAPRVEGALLSASLDGYASLSQPAPDASDRRMELVLHQPQAKHGMVAGQVIDDRGAPAAGARVSLGHCKPVISDRGGSFTIAIPEAGPREQWIAVKDGHQPAIEGASAAVKNGSAEAAEFVLLRLGPPPLSISGRVVDDEGKPQSGFKVFIADPTFFGAFDEIPMHLEGMLSGAATRSDLEQLMAKAPEGSDPEAVLKETSSVMWTFVRTDSDGNFRLGGLLDRTYRVAVLDPETLLRVDSESIPAGTADALLRLPKSAYLENLRGRVVTRAGKPVAGVRLAPNIDVLTVHIDEHSWSTLNVDAGSVLTDAEGRFVFERLPREHVYLEVTGEDILPLDWARKQAGGIEAAAGDKKDQIVIQVDLRYHFQVEVAADLADELRVVDSRGLGVMINGFEGNSRMSTDVMPLVEGRSKVMVVGEEARTLVLFKEKQEVARIQLSLVLGQLNVVRM